MLAGVNETLALCSISMTVVCSVDFTAVLSIASQIYLIKGARQENVDRAAHIHCSGKVTPTNIHAKDWILVPSLHKLGLCIY